MKYTKILMQKFILRTHSSLVSMAYVHCLLSLGFLATHSRILSQLVKSDLRLILTNLIDLSNLAKGIKNDLVGFAGLGSLSLIKVRGLTN